MTLATLRAAFRSLDRMDLAILSIGAALLAAYLSATSIFAKPSGRVVFGDATHHFVQLRSMVFDHDLQFRNEYTRIYDLRGGEPGTEWISTDLTRTGHVRNYMPVGPALLWAPLYIVVAGAQEALALVGLAAPPDGFDRALQIVPGVTGSLAATIGAWLCWRLARRWTDAVTAAVATVAVWLGSHAIYYALVSPSYSHAASMLTSAIFFSRWLDGRDRPSVGRFAEWGGLAGLSALMRWQDAIFLLVPLVAAITWRVPWRTRLIGCTVALGAWLVVFSPQMLVWHVLYGQPFAVPQGPSFMRWTSPHPIDVLFSSSHGLFSWAPMLVPAVVGLAVFALRQRELRLMLAVLLAGSWYINAAVADWWAGEAFGARRFLSLFPLFVLGLATWLHAPGWPFRTRRSRITVVCILFLMNGLLLLQYQLYMKGLREIAPYPQGGFDMWLARFAVPWRLLTWWRS
jgi:hypothetical protein